MSRPARFDDDQVLDAALAAVVSDGRAAGISAIAAHLGGGVGSIYHRFGSREEILARLWLRSVERFQAGLFAVAARADGDPHDTLVRLAGHVPAYCRAHRDEAVALTLHRADVLAATGPPAVRADAAHLNDRLQAMTTELTGRRYGRTDRGAVALVELATRISPYGLVRPYLGRAVPRRVDEAVAAAADAILRLGDAAPGDGARG